MLLFLILRAHLMAESHSILTPKPKSKPDMPLRQKELTSQILAKHHMELRLALICVQV